MLYILEYSEGKWVRVNSYQPYDTLEAVVNTYKGYDTQIDTIKPNHSRLKGIRILVVRHPLTKALEHIFKEV